MLKVSLISGLRSFKTVAMQNAMVTEEMNALVFHEYGTADILKYESVPKPSITGPDDIIIKVMAAGLTHGDLKIREGHMKYLFPMKFPITLGMDYSGIIVAKGDKVQGFQVNDNVYGQFNFPNANGAFADYTKLNSKNDVILHKPNNLPFVEAAGVTTPALAAYSAVVDHGKLRHAGDKRVLIIGSAGSIGSWSTQFAKHFGAHVTSICSEVDIETCRSLGANDVLDYTASDFKNCLLAVGQFDLVIDTVGGDDYWFLLEPRIKDGGVYSTQAGDTKFGGDGNPLISLLRSGLKVIPRNFFARVSYKLYTDSPRSYCTAINELIKDGKVKCFVNHQFELKDGASAQKQLETRLTAGRIVLIPKH